MADIFGRMPEDYEVVQARQAANIWDRYQQQQGQRMGLAQPVHNFDALGVEMRAAQDQSAIGYLTNNMLAIQTMIEEILYTDYRLPEFIYINTSVPEGARSHGVRVVDRVGRAERISAPGYDAPSATTSEAIVTIPLHLYGIDAKWSADELRGAMMAGHPLDTYAVDAAVKGAMETMEAVGLTGGEYAERGLCNLPTTGDDAVSSSNASGTFASMTSAQIRTAINGEISKVIEGSRETLGRNLSTGMSIYLPGTQYDSLTDRYIGDNAERTLMKSIIEDNPWTHFTRGQPLMIHRLLELDSALNPGVSNDRMITALKHNRVAEMAVSIMPRVLMIEDKGRYICAQIEAKFSPLFVKLPTTIYYLNSI